MEKQESLYVGTYSVQGSEGIYEYDFNIETGELTKNGVTPNNANPSFICISPNQKFLYAVSEINNYNQMDSGSITAYKIENNGLLNKINQVATLGNHPCHVSISSNSKNVVASNYTSGSISIYCVNSDGSLNEKPQLIQHYGSGPDTTRQKGPHAHSSQFFGQSSTIITADLGVDKLFFYTYDDDSMKYVKAMQPYVEISPGAGPRHFTYTKDKQYIYVMNEMASSVSVLRKKDDEFNVIQTISSLPVGFLGENKAADIHISSDERFIYCSNRGHNSIAVFKRNMEDGSLILIQNESVRGDWPRNFTLSPKGKYILVANQNSNNIVVLIRNKESGKLSFSGKSYDIPSPVCLKFR
jgi:6-phosphogluconolactonase